MQGRSQWTRLRSRVGAELGAKVAVWLGLAVGICVPYFTIQRLDLFPRRAVPATAIDAWVAFDPRWIGAYLSIALLVPLAPLLAAHRDELRRYARGLALLCGVCFAVFLLAPVDGPRPAPPPDAAVYGWLVAHDRPANSMPSLHAGLTVYSLLFAGRALWRDLERAARAALVLAGASWGALILYSTLATGQHWFLDLPAGALVAVAAHLVVWRGVRLRAAASRATAPGR